MDKKSVLIFTLGVATGMVIAKYKDTIIKQIINLMTNEKTIKSLDSINNRLTKLEDDLVNLKEQKSHNKISM
ncbi:MAG: hypothetical protein N2749_01080 [Clostridia bacterium]|nr:hypothetical protein [Clostridia bacterium]